MEETCSGKRLLYDKVSHIQGASAYLQFKKVLRSLRCLSLYNFRQAKEVYEI